MISLLERPLTKKQWKTTVQTILDHPDLETKTNLLNQLVDKMSADIFVDVDQYGFVHLQEL